LAAWFLWVEIFGRGPTILVYFEDAAGLIPNKSEIKYRGATIGTVETVTLTPDRQRVEVTISLERSAASVAREGSRFWIQKPEVAVTQIRGLRTIVSGDYISVESGNGRPQVTFAGLSEPPIPQSPGALRIVLLAERLGSIRKGAPIFYRGIQVSDVTEAD
jgi:paraquat-inducible protein B